MDERDRRHLERARELARRGWGRVHPNPLVGCVLVREGEIVGEGWHREYGGPHAEVHALREAGARAEDSTVYVSLEPCDHHGHTPPCSEALIEAGVARVVYGGAEPQEKEGGGAERLRRAGVEVLGPVLDRQTARSDNPAFYHLAEARTTYVEVKLAVSLDGGIAAAPGRTTSITGPEARREVHRLRAGFDGILVGSRTVAVDDPLLTVRDVDPPRRPPARLVADSRCRTRPDAALFDDVDEVPVYVFTTEEAPTDRVRALESSGARVIEVAGGPRGVDLRAMLDRCWEEEIRAVFCEGGGRLVASLLQEGLCHRIDLFLAPRLLGADAVPAFPRAGKEDPLEGWRVTGARAGVGRDGVVILEPPGGERDDPEDGCSPA